MGDSVNRDKAEAHSDLGATYFGQGKLDDAEREYIEALKINPNDTGAHSDLGTIYLHQGKLDDAEREYKESLRIDPNDADAHCALGTTYFNKDKLDYAEREYKEALKIDPDHADARENLNLLHNDASSKQDLATETSGQEIAAVAPLEAEDETRVNQVNASEKEEHHHGGIAGFLITGVAKRLCLFIALLVGGGLVGGLGYWVGYIGIAGWIMPILGWVLIGVGGFTMLAGIVFLFLPNKLIDELFAALLDRS